MSQAHVQIDLNDPYHEVFGVAIHPRDGRTYVTCSNGSMTGILALNPTEVVVGSGTAGYCDGTGANARCSQPWGLTFAKLTHPLLAGGNDEDVLLLGEAGALRAVFRAPDTNSWSVATLAGGGADHKGFDDGRAAAAAAATAAAAAAAAPAGMAAPAAPPLASSRPARLGSVCGIAACNSTGSIFFTEWQNNNRVRELRLAVGGGAVTTLAGSGWRATIDGNGTAAAFASPYGIALDPREEHLYEASHCIRRVHIATGAVVVMAGTPGASGRKDSSNPRAAKFNSPTGLAMTGDGTLLIADYSNHCIRSLETVSGRVSTFIKAAAGIKKPVAMAIHPDGGLVVTTGRLGIVHRFFGLGLVPPRSTHKPAQLPRALPTLPASTTVLSELLWSTQQRDELTDLTILVGGRQLRAHALVVAARSPLIRRMVLGGSKGGAPDEPGSSPGGSCTSRGSGGSSTGKDGGVAAPPGGNGGGGGSSTSSSSDGSGSGTASNGGGDSGTVVQHVVELDDASYEATERLLRYMYTGELQIDDDDGTLSDVLLLAWRLGLQEAAAVCERHLVRGLCPSNAAQRLAWAMQQLAGAMKQGESSVQAAALVLLCRQVEAIVTETPGTLGPLLADTPRQLLHTV